MRWKIQPQRSSSAALVHRGDCALYPVEGGFLTREEAAIALYDDQPAHPQAYDAQARARLAALTKNLTAPFLA
ncbi:DUF6233 domain-containing protein [Streptomyces sp. NPDC004728]|uniref:DUF6233 domain-containing protein n=1 Tax=Streptomyces sp. NPDC004728 TaxID=3154289 RepID=UPI0033AD0C3A